MRKAMLTSLLRARLLGLQFNPLAHPGNVVFRHAGAKTLEGIVSKRLGSRYVSGRTRNSLQPQFCLRLVTLGADGGAQARGGPWGRPSYIGRAKSIWL